MAAIKTRAVRDGDHYVLNGSKMFITNGVMADLYFVAARLAGRGAAEGDKRHQGISMFLVERSTPGFTVSRKLDKMGMLASDTAELSFQDMRVPVEFSGRHVRGRGFIRNISESGALVEDAQPLVVSGGRVRLRFSFFQDSLPVEIPATVVRETPIGFAVQFAGLDARLKSVLALVIARIRAADYGR